MAPGELRPGIRSAPFRLLLAATTLAFGGYSLLLPVVPLWAARGGSGSLGAGVTTGVLMGVTVLTQLGVPRLLRRCGHRPVLVVGTVLMGVPSPLFALSAELAPLLALSVVRGVGFGLVTVAGSALVAELVPPAEHGRASGLFGLAVGLPQLVLLPTGVATADAFGFPAVFIAGAVPLLGVPLLLAIRIAPGADHPAVTDGDPGPQLPWRVAAGPVLAMLTCALAQGGLVTFLPIAAPAMAAAVAVALFATAAGSLIARLAAGELVDRRGLGGRLLMPGVLLCAIGLAAEAFASAGSGGGAATLVVSGAFVVGVGFGLVQNDALVALFAAAGPRGYGTASAMWNAAYDAGTGIGAVGLGAIADPFGFRAAFGAAALLLLVTAPVTRRR